MNEMKEINLILRPKAHPCIQDKTNISQYKNKNNFIEICSMYCSVVHLLEPKYHYTKSYHKH